MAYVQLSESHVNVLHVHQCLANLGFMVYLKKLARYQHVKYCTYWSVLGSYKNCNIIQLTPKSTLFEAFDEIHKVVLDSTSDNMASSVQPGMHSVINKDDTTTN